MHTTDKTSYEHEAFCLLFNYQASQSAEADTSLLFSLLYCGVDKIVSDCLSYCPMDGLWHERMSAINHHLPTVLHFTSVSQADAMMPIMQSNGSIRYH